MAKSQPISVDVRATLKEFKEEGLTAAEAANLLSCHINQASAALSSAYTKGLATRKALLRTERHGSREFRYYPTDKPQDFINKKSAPLGVSRHRQPKLRIVKQHLKPIIYTMNGLYTYHKLRIGTAKHRHEANLKAAMYCIKMNRKGK